MLEPKACLHNRVQHDQVLISGKATQFHTLPPWTCFRLHSPVYLVVAVLAKTTSVWRDCFCGRLFAPAAVRQGQAAL